MQPWCLWNSIDDLRLIADFAQSQESSWKQFFVNIFFQLVAYENYFPMQSNGLWPSDETIERLGETMFQKSINQVYWN